MSKKLKAGDLVEVRSAAEILATLDERGCLENLPFMLQLDKGSAMTDCASCCTIKAKFKSPLGGMDPKQTCDVVRRDVGSPVKPA